MIAWLSANLVNIALILAVVLLVAFVIGSMRRDRKAGKAPCGGNCAKCGGCACSQGCARCGHS